MAGPRIVYSRSSTVPINCLPLSTWLGLLNVILINDRAKKGYNPRPAAAKRRRSEKSRILGSEHKMQLSGMLYGAPLLKHVDFPCTEVLGPDATEDEIKDLIERWKLIFIKPLLKSGVGKKGKAGLVGKATDLET